MDSLVHSQEQIAKRALEDVRMSRTVTHLSKFQKKVLSQVLEREDENFDGVEHRSNEAAALHYLEALGLVTLRSTKAGIWGALSDKGKLLLYENPKLVFPVPEYTRWIITTAIAVSSLVLGIVK